MALSMDFFGSECKLVKDEASWKVVHDVKGNQFFKVLHQNE